MSSLGHLRIRSRGANRVAARRRGAPPGNVTCSPLAARHFAVVWPPACSGSSLFSRQPSVEVAPQICGWGAFRIDSRGAMWLQSGPTGLHKATLETSPTFGLGEAEPRDGAVSHYPAQRVGRQVVRRPERSELPVADHPPVAPAWPASFGVGSSPVGSEDL